MKKKKSVMKNALNQKQPPYSAEGVSMEAVSCTTARSASVSQKETGRRNVTRLSLNVTLVYEAMYIRI